MQQQDRSNASELAETVAALLESSAVTLRRLKTDRAPRAMVLGYLKQLREALLGITLDAARQTNRQDAHGRLAA